MDPELETALQVVGVLAGAAGTYFAWRQYRLAKDVAARGHGPSGEVFLTKNEFNVVYAGLGVTMLLIAGYLLLNPRTADEATLWADRGLSLALLLMAAWSFDQNERENHIEIDGEALTLRTRGSAPIRVPWDRITAVSIVRDDRTEQLIIRTHEHGGVIAGLDPMWDAAIRPGYRVCHLRDVKPSTAALRAALGAHSGGLLRD
ncbi:hypothetical protein [Phytomonospora endophytica]|uniref:PH domain-containing protein n=1 Tax=Phytomonospora endophytica TaxID=714109 RepID=A0A841FK72_9ACTN|nr:hypothetical protein [Phytomonospora endophytica]MBB6033039.1 hypothetical protein [Phytomonospora endophytica]GIG65266.1 hypothetical protein Pen01_15610 [Phytomonospora endophytica]